MIPNYFVEKSICHSEFAVGGRRISNSSTQRDSSLRYASFRMTIFSFFQQFKICSMAEKGKYIYDWPRLMVIVDAAVFTFSGGSAKVLLINRGNL